MVEASREAQLALVGVTSARSRRRHRREGAGAGGVLGAGRGGDQVAVDGRRQHGDSGNEADDTDSDSGGGDGEELGVLGTPYGAAATPDLRGMQPHNMEEPYCGRALYAEERKHVSIIFSDVVRFSRIVDGAPASKVRADTI